MYDDRRASMRICSLLPSATEILYALGLGDSVVGVTFECDHPEEARRKPHLVGSVLGHDLSPQEIDRVVSEHAARGESIYRIDQELLESFQPDLIVTQELCDVCAVNTSHLAKALHGLSFQPQVVSLTPHSLEDVFADIEAVGRATGSDLRARELIASLRNRLEAIRTLPKPHAPKVACLEWLSPPFNAGHWVPEMVSLAGGLDRLGARGTDSVRIHWEEVRALEPDILLVMPCGYDAQKAADEYRQTDFPDWWATLPAVSHGCVYAVHANAFFSRPGPRLVDGVEILYTLLQGDFGRPLPKDAWLQI